MKARSALVRRYEYLLYICIVRAEINRGRQNVAVGLEGAASARAAEYATPPRAKAARSKQGASASASAAACESPASLRASLGDGEVKPGYVKPKLATIVPWAPNRY